jgi:hypothetical protein
MQGGKNLVGSYRIILGSREDSDSKEIIEEAKEEEEAIVRGRKSGFDVFVSG